MCLSSSKPQVVEVEKPIEKPVVEKTPDPTPQAVVNPTDAGAANERTAAENEKQRKRRGYSATRVAADRNVLTDTAQDGKKSTLG
jgi:hypothetical protein